MEVMRGVKYVIMWHKQRRSYRNYMLFLGIPTVLKIGEVSYCEHGFYVAGFYVADSLSLLIIMKM